MTRRGIVPLSVSLVLLTFLIVPLVAGTPAESAFKKLQSLAGQWEGKDAHGMAAKTSFWPPSASYRIWHYLRSHWLANSVFISLADVMDACEMAWNRFATNHSLIRSLCAVAWAPASPAL